MLEQAKEEAVTCKQSLKKYKELFEKEKAILMKINDESREATRAATIKQMQEVVARFDDAADRSCRIM
jgi:hypothetical protein